MTTDRRHDEKTYEEGNHRYDDAAQYFSRPNNNDDCRY